MGKSIFVASGKGGVGKSTLVTGLGACLAAMGAEVLCVDADAGIRSLDLLFGLENRTILDLGDIISGTCGLREAVVRHDSLPGLSLLNAPYSLDRISARGLAAVERYAAQSYDYVLVDCPAGAAEILQGAARGADLGILVATPEPTSIRAAEHAAAVASEAGGEALSLRLVLNRVQPETVGRNGLLNVDDAIDGVGVRLLGILPEDPRITAYASSGRIPVLESTGGAPAAMLRIARRITGQRVQLPNFKA